VPALTPLKVVSGQWIVVSEEEDAPGFFFFTDH